LNLNVLSMVAMIALAKFWLTDAAARAVLASHELGRAYRNQVQVAYDLLRALQMRRSNAKKELRALTAAITALDGRHDNKARALYHHLVALCAGSEDADLVAACDQLLRQFFPKKLRFIKWSYVDEGGWAESMSEQMTPELHAQLATVQVGDQTLADLFDAWFEAGMELAQKTLVRSRLDLQLSADGVSEAAIDARPLRHRWIRAVQGMLNGLGFMGLSDEQLETLLSPLKKSIAAAEARLARGEPDVDSDPGAGDGESPEPDMEPDMEPSLPSAGPGTVTSAEPSSPSAEPSLPSAEPSSPS
jgi:hypothetical protein